MAMCIRAFQLRLTGGNLTKWRAVCNNNYDPPGKYRYNDIKQAANREYAKWEADGKPAQVNPGKVYLTKVSIAWDDVFTVSEGVTFTKSVEVGK